MDSSNTAQDVTRCDLCGIAIVQSYCDVCHVNLCTPCIGLHIANEYDKHKIVSFEQRKSTLIYPKCEEHSNKTCEFQCKDCDVFVCSHCIASTQHKGHEYLNLEELFTTSEERIKKETEELENLISPTYEEIAADTENQIATLDGEYRKLTTEMSNQRKELHRDIDTIFNQIGKEIGEMKVKHLGILKKHLGEIKHIQSLIHETKFTLNQLEESNEVYRTINYNSKSTKLSKLPPKIQILMPNFTPKRMERETLRRFLGELTPLTTTLVERVLITKKAHSSAKKLLDKPKVLKTIKTGHERIRNVACCNEEQIWTSGGTDEIKCFSIQGVIQKTMKTKSGKWPTGIAVDIDEALFYSTTQTRSVNKIKCEQIEEIIKLPGWIPLNLCVTSSGDLLVTMRSDDKTQSKVVRYSGSTINQTIQFDDEGKPLYSGNSQVKYITENRNLDICVADWTACAVVVVNEAGKLRFRYTGHPSPSMNKPFTPSGIITDSQSRILTGDYLNYCIHIFDQDGQFLHYIDSCELKCPLGLCIDINENLYVCEYIKGDLKAIRYLE